MHRTLTKDDFLQELEKSTSRRKKELHVLFSITSSAQSERYKHTLMRASTVLFYAHWQGFVRESSDLFLRFLEQKNVQLADLKESFIVLLKSDGVEIPVSVARKKLREDVSNLNPKKMRRIAWILGLDYCNFEPTENFMNQFLKRRNKIAHGELAQISDDEFREIERLTYTLIELFAEQIILSVSEERFFREDPIVSTIVT